MKRIFLLVYGFTCIIISCNKNNAESPSLLQWPITKVEGATSATVNQTIPLTVYWPFSSGSCDVLDKFTESRNGNIVSIKAYGHTSSGICTTDAGTKTKIYNFTATNTGVYELRFINRDSSFIPFTITIN